MALATMGLGQNVGGLLLPPLLTAVALARGWRSAFQVLALIIWILILPTILLRTGDAPKPAPVEDDGADAEPLDKLRLRDGIRRSTFWLLALAMFFHILFFAGITVHFVAFATDIGFS